MIFVGSVLGGPELDGSVVASALQKVTASIESARQDFIVGSSPALNIVFHVSGSITCVNFDEMRESKFSRASKLLMIQVPFSIESDDETSLIDEALHFLHQANAIGFHYFDAKKMVYSLARAESLVEAARRDLLG